MLLKALLLQILFSIRSERQLVEAVNYNPALSECMVGRIWGYWLSESSQQSVPFRWL